MTKPPLATPRAARSPWAAIIVGTVLSAAACGGTAAPPQRPPVPVAIATARRAAVPVNLNANGTVSPMQTANVSAQVDGLITHVAFQEGQEVGQGQVLFQIDARPYRAAYNQALAALARDSATAVYAARELVRYDSLVAKDYVTKEQADQQRANASAAQATLAADHALVATAQFNLDNTTVRAPIAGRTGNLLIRAGNLVHGTTATPLVVINQIHPILVTFAVPATNLPDILKYSTRGPLPVTVYQAAVPSGAQASTPGSASPRADASADQPPATTVGPPAATTHAPSDSSSRRPMRGSGTGPAATSSGPPSIASSAAPAANAAPSTDATTDSSGGSVSGGGPPGGGVYGATSTFAPTGPGTSGSLSFINNAIDTATGTVLLKANFANGGRELWPGEFVATVLRLFIEPNALVVPSQAIMTGQQGAYVFVIDSRNNTAQQRSVTIERSTDTLAVISSGLAVGERVVTDGQSRLQNGAKVNVRAIMDPPTSSGSESPSPNLAPRTTPR